MVDIALKPIAIKNTNTNKTICFNGKGMKIDTVRQFVREFNLHKVLVTQLFKVSHKIASSSAPSAVGVDTKSHMCF